MSAIRLSICIPVHNFGAFLGDTLESIVQQATEDVEIVVLDGASTDDTPDVVRRFQARFPRLTYVRRDKKGGIDRDMALSVEAARGEHCWLFSGDDLMRPDAIQRLRSELKGGCDVYLLESMLCRFDMSPIAMHRMLDLREPRTFHLEDQGERREYFRLSLNSAAFFSFCSALVIRKSRWDEARFDDSFYGTCWAHAARLMSIIPAGLSVRYLPGAFLDKRGDNDSFLTNGLTHRLGIAVDGYQRIADEICGRDTEEARLIRRAIRREIPWQSWLAAKVDMMDGGRLDQMAAYRRLLRKQFPLKSPGNAFARAVCYTPIPLLRVARRVVRALRGQGPPSPPRRSS